MQRTGVAAVGRRPANTSSRLIAIDALRGFVMAVMLLDHVRETWFLHMQVSDPVDAKTVLPALFFTRMFSMICAPVFVALTGLSAYLYNQTHSNAETRAFLLSRGLFLMVLEVTFVNFAWSAKFPAPIIWFQIIFCIGFCMVALAALIGLPRGAKVALGLVIVCLHNLLLDPIHLTQNSPFFFPWALLHQRETFVMWGQTFKTTYPVLPWVGVILLGYGIGPWFTSMTTDARRTRFIQIGVAMLALFLVLRGFNIYGDRPWEAVPGAPLRSLMAFLALTKYPPSLLFLLPTLGLGCLLMARFERFPDAKVSHWFATLGGAPMFFYLLHLYVLKAFYLIAVAIWGMNKGQFFGVDNIGWVWAWYFGLLVPLYFPTRWFSNLKKRRKDIWWLKYL